MGYATKTGNPEGVEQNTSIGDLIEYQRRPLAIHASRLMKEAAVIP